jgi:ribonuclease D
VRAVGSPAVDHRWIDDQAAFSAVLDELAGASRYALDTEFHRERTYYPKLALVQLAWETSAPGGLVLVDPLAVDVSELGRLFERDTLCVIHAAQQDLDVLTHSVGSVPRRIFDTQIAAGFVGYGTPSLVSLLQGELGVTPTKGDRLTDWLRRPLTEGQRNYAAADVAHLLEVHDGLARQLDERGRASWAEEAFEELRTRPVSGAAPDDAWMRVKDARSLRPRARAVARSVAAWRERRAMQTDIPVRQVLPDLAVLGVAQRAPRTVRELGQARRRDPRCGGRGPRGGAARGAALGRRPRPQPAPGGDARLGVGEPARPRRADRHRAARHAGRHRRLPPR